MTTILHPVLIIILAYFAVFILAVGYAQWTTRGMDVHRAAAK